MDSPATPSTAETVLGQRLPPYGWLLRFLEPLRGLFREAFAISFFVNLLAIAGPIFVLQVYDRVVSQRGISTLLGLSFGMILVVIFDFVLRHARSKLMQHISLRIDVEVGRRLFDKVMALPLRALEVRPATFWQTLFRDVEGVRNVVSGPSALLVADLPFALMFMGVIFIIAWPMAWVMVVIFALFVTLAWRSGQVVAALAERERTKALNRDALMGELIMGRSTIKALALGDRVRGMWEERQADTIEQSIERGGSGDMYTTMGQSLTTVATISMTAVGSLAIMEQELTIGSLIAANMLSGRILGPFNMLVGTWRGIAAFKQSVARLGALFDEGEDLSTSPIALPRPKGRITMERLSFKYAPDAPPVVDDINLDIAAGGVTAIMGRNGCGKTTLIKLILGLYRPTTGRVLLDGADLSQYARSDIARMMGYVPQECVLFNGSIRTNIAYGRTDASDDDIIRAATMSQAHPLIIDLPQGYGTQVGEGGGRMSGGMRQRIAIARAFVGDPPVVVLDEPTGSLDRQAEDALRESLMELGRSRTVLVVTHSPVILQACHNIIVMDGGRIRAAGPAQKILDMMAAQRAGAVPISAAKAGPKQAGSP